ncbi:hypothetical protein cyc_00048 [Cyclospora cayetanensis]|uniref:Uncharacterized protein n=1 Tax=Cyclospora cayetanensis TaxID=88456 RepID=A0A1D3CVI3_9EIME|nr:hypothetical protein cyc_00048 [Cyclospora cayetanensis]
MEAAARAQDMGRVRPEEGITAVRDAFNECEREHLCRCVWPCSFVCVSICLCVYMALLVRGEETIHEALSARTGSPVGNCRKQTPSQREGSRRFSLGTQGDANFCGQGK